MSVSLKAFAESLSKGSVTVRGQPLPIRALKDSETGRLLSLFPRPIAPLGPDLTRGSLAPPVPNENDPAHRVACEVWYELYRRVQIAIACGFAESGADQAALKATSDELGESFTRPELGRIYSAIIDLMSETAQKRARDALIVDLTNIPADQQPHPAVEMPKDYGTTRTYAKLEVCAYFHIDPRAVDDFDPGLMALLAEHVKVRKGEGA